MKSFIKSFIYNEKKKSFKNININTHKFYKIHNT